MGGRAWALYAFESYFIQEIAGRDLGGLEKNMKILGTQSREEWKRRLEGGKEKVGLLHDFSEGQS